MPPQGNLQKRDIKASEEKKTALMNRNHSKQLPVLSYNISVQFNTSAVKKNNTDSILLLNILYN